MLFAVDIGDRLYLDPANTVGGIYGTFSVLLNLLVRNIFVIGGVLTFLYLISAGVKLALAGGNPKEIEGARGMITAAIMGFAVIFAAYWIIMIIEKVTGVAIFKSNL